VLKAPSLLSIGHQSFHSPRDLVCARCFMTRPSTHTNITAAFGAEISNPILGYVIPLSSFTSPCSDPGSTTNTGCPKLCTNGPHQPEPSETWIALVQRGGCEFVTKVREAQRLGARAVVVGGENPAISGLPDTLINMFSPGMWCDFIVCYGRLTLCSGCIRRRHRCDIHQIRRLRGAFSAHRIFEHVTLRSADTLAAHNGRVFCLGMVFVSSFLRHLTCTR
jgi:hypothetical protein